jgi:hypothetical protein
LFTIFNKKHKIIFLDTSSPNIDISKKVNIILSPSLYWVKKLSLPIEKSSEVQKLLESIFEDILPAGDYSYSVYKENNYFIAFAYDDNLILDTLKEKGIKIRNVAGIYFAQKELSFIDSATKITDTQSVFIKDDILILLPSEWVKDDEFFNINKISLSNHTIRLSQYGHNTSNNNKNIYKIGTTLIILISIIISELIIINTKISNYSIKKELLFKKAKLQATMFQNKAMLKKFNKIHTKQTKIRELMSSVLSAKLQSSEVLTKLILKDKKLTAYYSIISKKTLIAIQKELRAKKIRFSIKKKKEHHIIEMIL